MSTQFPELAGVKSSRAQRIGFPFLILISFLTLLTSQAIAQNAPQDERHFLFYHAKELTSRMNGGSVQPNWMADGESFWYAEGPPDDAVIWRVNPRANAKERFFDSSRLRVELAQAGVKLPEKGLPFREFHFLNESEEDVYFSVAERDFVLNLDSYRLEEAKRRVSNAPAPSEAASPDGRWFAHIRRHNVILRPASKGDEVELTTDGSEEHSWGQPVVWSPDSSKFAVRRIDFKGVPQIPIVDFLQKTEQVTWEYYSRPGDVKPQTELFIFDVGTKRRTLVDIGQERDLSVLPLTWRPDGDEFFFLRPEPSASAVYLMAARPSDGATRVVLSEENMDVPKVLHPLNDGKRFIWQLERDGWNHLYLFDFEGMLHCRLTRGAFPVHEIVTVDETAGWVYFTARDDPKRPYDIHLCRVDLQGHNFARLTEAEGQHVVSFCPSKAFFLDTHSAVGRPPTVELRSSDGKRLKTLSKADVTTLRRLGWRPPEEVVVKAADCETDLWGVLYKPYDFDPSKKYPVINIVYGWIGRVYAPHSFKKLSHDFQGLANSGFIVWVLDGRGTAGRGRDFRRVVLGNVGRFEVSDLAVGLKQAAATRPFMNMDRVGVYGVSYGGYMALRAILTRPDVYKVGVAVCPITDLSGHMWNEFLLGPIEDNQAAYNYASNLPLAKNLKGKLLLIHGSSDRAVPFSHTMKMADALIQENKAFDLIVLPGQDHVGGYQYWWDALRRYFEEHLKP